MNPTTPVPVGIEAELKAASLPAIARIIETDWNARAVKGVAPDARPYLEAMRIPPILAFCDHDYIVAAFLDTAYHWHGPVARITKAELKRRLKAHA